MHHQGSIGRSSHTTSSEVDYRQLAVLVYILHEVVGSLQLLGSLVQLVFAHGCKAFYFALHHAHVGDSLHHVARSWFALSAYHRGTFGNAAQSLAQVLGTADERHVKLRLVDVVNIVGRREYLALVDVVYLYGLQYLCLGKVANAALCHHGYGDSLLYALYHLGVAHTRHATGCTDVCWNALQSHHCTCTGCFGNLCLLRCRYIHNHTALEHLCQVAVQFLSVLCHIVVCFLMFITRF